MNVTLTDLSSDLRVRDTSADAVTDYAEAMAAGVKFPPIAVFKYTDGSLHLADGFHRVAAAMRAGLATLPALVQDGDRQIALKYALGANRANSQRRTAQDIRQAVAIALKEWPNLTQAEVASLIGCSQPTVARVKADVIQVNNTEVPAVRVDSIGRTQPTVKPRATPAPATTPAPAVAEVQTDPQRVSVYRAAELERDPGRPVLITATPAAAVAAGRVLRGFACVGVPEGTDASMIDWSPLQGRRCAIWAPQREAFGIQRAAKKAGIESPCVAMVDKLREITDTDLPPDAGPVEALEADVPAAALGRWLAPLVAVDTKPAEIAAQAAPEPAPVGDPAPAEDDAMLLKLERHWHESHSSMWYRSGRRYWKKLSPRQRAKFLENCILRDGPADLAPQPAVSIVGAVAMNAAPKCPPPC